MNEKQKQKSNLPVVSKTFQKNGKWIERPQKSTVSVCSCGNKYLKTRPNQLRCLLCMRRP